MKFVISSSTLLSQLQNSGKVISSRQVMPILECFLFELKDGVLQVTASDIDTTLTSSIEVDSCEAEGQVAIPSKIILDSLKEFSDQPITINADNEKRIVTITWSTGNLSLPCEDADDYPRMQVFLKEEESKSFSINTRWLYSGISKSIYAAANDELRPIMGGVFFDLDTESTTFVATDGHKLVRITNNNPSGVGEPLSFVLPKKPALLLRNILTKEDGDVNISVDPSSNNIVFVFGNYRMQCRTVEGRYPNYKSVIPKYSTPLVVVDRVALQNCIRRVSVCSSQSSNLIRMAVSQGSMLLSAQDTDFSVSAEDKVGCSYDGEPITIGFKSTFLIELLSNISSKEISIGLAESMRPGLFAPYDSDDDSEKDMIVLLMPLMQ